MYETDGPPDRLGRFGDSCGRATEFDARLRRTPFLALLFAVLASAIVPTAAQDGAAVRTTIFWGAEITYEVIDGLAVYQGDIILGTAAEVAG